MMQEEDRIDRRQEIGDVAVRSRIDGAHAADIVVDLVVRQALEHRELGRDRSAAVLCDGVFELVKLRYVGIVEVGRQQSRVYDELRHIVGGLGVELGIVARKIARAAGDREAPLAGDAMDG